MKILIYFYIIIVNIYITIEQKENNYLRKIESKKDSSKNKNKRLKSFLLHMGLIVSFIILLFIIIKIIINCCKKRYAFKKLYEDFKNNKLIKEEIIDQVKYIYGFEYIISFLKNKVLIPCKYKDKISELKNCGNCSICQNGFELSDKIFITPCNHVYHNNCMTDYLNLIIKEIEPEEKEIEDFHNYFKCPNCKEYLFANKYFLENKKEENRIDEKVNQNNLEILKHVEVKVMPHKSRKNITNIISTEGSSLRNLSSLTKNNFNKKNKKKKKPTNINNENQNNENKNNKIIPKYINSDRENTSNIQSNMKLKENLNNSKNNENNQSENKEKDKDNFREISNKI